MGSIPALSILRGEVRHFNSTPLLLHRLLEQTVCLSGQKEAVTFHDKTLSFETLDATASRVARALLQHVRSTGAQANQDGDRLVAVCMDPSDQLVVTLLAVWKTGAAYLPLDSTSPPARVSHILSEAQPMLIITDKGEFCFPTAIHRCSVAVLYLHTEMFQTMGNSSGHFRISSSTIGCTNRLLTFHRNQCLTLRC
jgi:non-ribosomal peptide synthetase component F